MSNRPVSAVFLPAFRNRLQALPSTRFRAKSFQLKREIHETRNFVRGLPLFRVRFGKPQAAKIEGRFFRVFLKSACLGDQVDFTRQGIGLCGKRFH